jgi:hypothetical protein
LQKEHHACNPEPTANKTFIMNNNSLYLQSGHLCKHTCACEEEEDEDEDEGVQCGFHRDSELEDARVEPRALTF